MDYGTLGARGLQVAENGDLIAECAFVLAQFDPATVECKHLYDPEAFANSISYTTLQDTLAMTDGDLVTFYDLTWIKKRSKCSGKCRGRATSANCATSSSGSWS